MGLHFVPWQEQYRWLRLIRLPGCSAQKAQIHPKLHGGPGSFLVMLLYQRWSPNGCKTGPRSTVPKGSARESARFDRPVGLIRPQWSIKTKAGRTAVPATPKECPFSGACCPCMSSALLSVQKNAPIVIQYIILSNGWGIVHVFRAEFSLFPVKTKPYSSSSASTVSLLRSRENLLLQLGH